MNEAPKNQFEFIRKFNDDHREQFNDDLFVRDTDEIIEELKKAILSCQRSKYYTIRVDGFTVVEDYPTMIKLLHDQEAIKSDNKDKSFNKYDYITLKDTEMKLLIVNYFIAVPNPKSDAPKSKNLKVLIMVPKFIDKYYLKIFGTWYCPKLQIVDGSTYNNSQNPNSKNPNVAFKSMFMASRFYRYSTELKTTSGEVIKAVYYASSIFSKMVPGVKYILARYGLAGALHKFMIPDLILTSEDPKDENYYTVKKHNVFVSLPKFIFDNDVVAQSLMATIVSSINSKDYTADTVRTSKNICFFNMLTTFYNIIILDAWLTIFIVTCVCPLSFRMRITLFRVLSRSLKHPVCVFVALLINSIMAASSTSYPSRYRRSMVLQLSASGIGGVAISIASVPPKSELAASCCSCWKS